MKADLPLGVVGEKSFSDPTSETWGTHEEKTDWLVGFSLVDLLD